MFKRVRFLIARAITVAVCEPQLRLGRRRHDGTCDYCGAVIEEYAMERLDFPVDDWEEAGGFVDHLRKMAAAEYERTCLECGGDDG